MQYLNYRLFGILLIPLLFACSPVLDNNNSHPLEDKIWSVNKQQFITEQEFKAHLLDSDIILLGETHDNQQHHQLQALIIQWFIQNQQHPAIAFEMLAQKQQDKIDQFQDNNQSTYHKQTNRNQNIGDEFAQLVEWEKSGWPEWWYYLVVFETALLHHLPIIAANLDSQQIRKVIKQGENVLQPRYQELLKQYRYPEPIQTVLEQDIQASHCNMLPEKMLAPMVKAQQVRDLAMLSAIIDSLKQYNTLIMIAGSGHTRKDYGLPWYLSQALSHDTPAKQIVSIGFVETSQNKLQPADYTQAWGDNLTRLPFDYVWFTQRAEREDPCEKMKAYMQKKH